MGNILTINGLIKQMSLLSNKFLQYLQSKHYLHNKIYLHDKLDLHYVISDLRARSSKATPYFLKQLSIQKT